MVVYNTLYDLVVTYIIGEQVLVSGSYHELVCILVSTIGALFVMAVPFLVVWKLIKTILNAFGG